MVYVAICNDFVRDKLVPELVLFADGLLLDRRVAGLVVLQSLGASTLVPLAAIAEADKPFRNRAALLFFLARRRRQSRGPATRLSSS